MEPIPIVVNEEAAAEALKSNDQKENCGDAYNEEGRMSSSTTTLGVDSSMIRVRYTEVFSMQIFFLCALCHLYYVSVLSSIVKLPPKSNMFSLAVCFVCRKCHAIVQ